MRFAIYKGETSLEALVSRLFQLSGSDAATAANQAAHLLLQANPQLQDLTSVPPGAPIVVPDVALAVKESELAAPSALVPAAPAAALRQGLQSLPNALATSISAALAQPNATLAIVQRPELQQAAAKDPALAERLKQIAAQTTASIQQVQARQAAYQEAVAQVQNDLARVWKR